MSEIFTEHVAYTKNNYVICVTHFAQLFFIYIYAMKLNNPFIIAGYNTPEYFCDRDKETVAIIDALKNERNITLIAPRRMGKTGLIKNVFYRIELEENIIPIYIDIFSTQNLNGFVQLFASSVIGALSTKSEKVIKKVGSFFKSCRPTIVFDELTGLPQITVDIMPDKEESTLKEIFNYIGNCNKRCVIAIDEFQQIAEYPERGVEALLRSYIQFIPNAHFIFAGSKQHLMQEMFLSAKRPFYQSTQLITLDAIGKDAYYSFANSFFEAKRLSINPDAFSMMYDEFEGHTWYIQALLNRLYGYGKRVTDVSLINKAIQELVNEGEYGYQNLISAYSSAAVKLMKAVAKEGTVKEINSGTFISKYSLHAASSVNTVLKKLIEKEIIYKSAQGYSVYDRFMTIWLKRQP